MKKLESDYGCDVELIEGEVESNVKGEADLDELAEWSVTLRNRCGFIRGMTEMYEYWIEIAEG